MEFTKTHYETLGETVYSATHKSGLRVILIKKEGFKKSYATFSTKYGSINTQFVVPGEEEVTTVIDGIAHFLEHKVFEQPDGTNAFNDFSKYGANANAFTSFGVTNYLYSCTDHFYENLEILLNFVQTPYFTEENVEKEKGIIAQEIRMYEDDAEQTCMYNCLEAMYEKHPVRINIAGTVEEIMKTTPELLYKWEAWKRGGCLASEMEGATLFIVSAVRKCRAGAVFHCVWNQEVSQSAMPEKRSEDTSCAIKTAVEALRILIEKDKAK